MIELRKCIKCGNVPNIKLRWHGASSQGGDAHKIHCQCLDCQYEWDIPTLDAKELTLQPKKK